MAAGPRFSDKRVNGGADSASPARFAKPREKVSPAFRIANFFAALSDLCWLVGVSIGASGAGGLDSGHQHPPAFGSGPRHVRENAEWRGNGYAS